jgi:hypothetical protein
MEDDLNLFERGRRLNVFKNENDLKKIIIIFLKTEDDVHFFLKEDEFIFLKIAGEYCNQKQLKVKTMVVAPLWVT